MPTHTTETASAQDGYEAFLATKSFAAMPAGIAHIPQLNRSMFDYQRDVSRWALRLGRGALFMGTGTGKTLVELEWARIVAQETRKPVLILAPLAVTHQTVREGATFGIPARYCKSQESFDAEVIVANYERLDNFDPPAFGGIVLDESSILKSMDGKTRSTLIERFRHTPYKLAATATPAPNDHTELGNHAEFLGVMTAVEMLSMFFVHDGGETQKWRLKGHARSEFWKWVCSWAVAMRKPSDIGYSNHGYELPALTTHAHTVEAGKPLEGMLFPEAAKTLQERIGARRNSLSERVAKCAEIVQAEPNESWLIWCHLNMESQSLAQAIPGAVELTGSDHPDVKERKILDFAEGRIRVLVSKASICGYGINLQVCARQCFVGLSDSWEQYYQAVRRSWRFGQKRDVHIHTIAATTEGNVVDNLERKNREAEEMAEEMAANTQDLTRMNLEGSAERYDGYMRTEDSGDGWKIQLADCVEAAREIPTDSIHYSVYSPPFESLYTYSNSPRDMGNCRDTDEFWTHYRFLIGETFRALMPGRLVSIHCMNLPTSKVRDGVIGLRDFRGEIIRSFENAGFIYHSEVCIWKDPVTAMQRTKALGLLHKTIRKDSAMSRQGIPDYLVTFRKPGDNPEPIAHTHEEFPVQLWQRYASPIWMDINPSDTLQYRSARDNEDERHICLASGSLVLTREHGYLEIEDVEEGDHVLTHLGRWKPVLAKRCNGTANIIRLCAQGVADLRLTPDHKIWTRMAYGSRDKESAMKSDPGWAEAGTVIGSYLNLQLPPEEHSELTDDEWWIVGRWLGDGHRGGHRRTGTRGGLGQFYISCSHAESPSLIARLGKYAGHSAIVTATQIALVNLRPVVRDVLNRCGEGACNKKLPGEAVTLCAQKAESLLSGYLSADGHHVDKYERTCASSVSRGLLLGMALLAQRARGVVASVYAGRPEREGTILGRDVHMLQDWVLSFRDTDGYKKSGWIDDFGAWKKVRRIEDYGESEVWDLQVEDDSSFTAEGAIVHNCPLQLEVIRRAVRLWSNPGDVVWSPFAGIGSEGVVAIQEGRQFLGSELKLSYYRAAVNNLQHARADSMSLFDAVVSA